MGKNGDSNCNPTWEKLLYFCAGREIAKLAN